MREMLEALQQRHRSGVRVALARVVGTEGSAPRGPGAAMAVDEGGEVIGSVSGGCVEGAVVTEAQKILSSGAPRAVSFGYSDAEGIEVGLTCGGTVHLFIEPLDEMHLRAGSLEPCALATVIGGPGTGSKLVVLPEQPPEGSLGNQDLDRVVARDALGELEQGRSVIRHYGARGEAREEAVAVFIQSFTRPPHMIICGAVDFTAALASAAKLLGFRVTVCDAREPFATPKRFPMADEVVLTWPDRLINRVGDELGPADAICVLTHDPKFDVPALVAAVRTQAGYIGAMGSRRTHEERAKRLMDAGMGDQDLARVMSPIGLDIGARTPEETAISIVAEIIAIRTGRPAASLRDGEGPIH